MNWKYGLILVYREEDEEDICHLVELYEDENGEWNSYCNANIQSIKELGDAYADVRRDGVNEWFYENGSFDYDSVASSWDWEQKVLDN